MKKFGTHGVKLLSL